MDWPHIKIYYPLSDVRFIGYFPVCPDDASGDETKRWQKFIIRIYWLFNYTRLDYFYNYLNITWTQNKFFINNEENDFDSG